MISRPYRGQSQTLTYNHENRLASVTAGGQTTQYGYDGDGKLVKRTAGGQSTAYANALYEERHGGGDPVTMTPYNDRVACRDVLIWLGAMLGGLLGGALAGLLYQHLRGRSKGEG